MSLEQKDLELIERVIYNNGDDIAVSIGRSFERLEERITATEGHHVHLFTVRSNNRDFCTDECINALPGRNDAR